MLASDRMSFPSGWKNDISMVDWGTSTTFESSMACERVAKPEAKGAKVQAIESGNARVDTPLSPCGPTVKEL